MLFSQDIDANAKDNRKEFFIAVKYEADLVIRGYVHWPSVKPNILAEEKMFVKYGFAPYWAEKLFVVSLLIHLCLYIVIQSQIRSFTQEMSNQGRKSRSFKRKLDPKLFKLSR